MASTKIGLVLCKRSSHLILLNSIVKFAKPSASLRCISTTDKTKDSLLVKPTLKNDNLIYPEKDAFTYEGFRQDNNPPNWSSWGYSVDSIEADRTGTHLFFFWGCFVIVGCSFMYIYMSDIKLQDWSRREAFLELRRREELGLALIDKDLVPVHKFTVPSDEELGDFEINV